MSLFAVVPLKALSAGKRRLSGALSVSERAVLIRAMAHHVFSILLEVEEVAGVVALTNDASLVPDGCRQIHDPGTDLNTAVAYAGCIVESMGATSMLVVAADLPFVTAHDIRCMLAMGHRDAAVFAADHAGTGTNAILISPPSLLRPSYGDRSLEAHLRTAQRLGVRANVVRREGLARDIDEPVDLSYLAGRSMRRLVG